MVDGHMFRAEAHRRMLCPAQGWENRPHGNQPHDEEDGCRMNGDAVPVGPS